MQTSHLTGSSEFSHHDACPDCGSSDGLAVYTDEHTYCFVCHAWTPGNGSQSSPKINMTMSYVRLCDPLEQAQHHREDMRKIQDLQRR